MERLAVYILPEHIWKDIDEKEVQSFKNEGTEAEPTVGAGPFVMVERQVGQFIRLKANDTFFGGRPAVDEVVFRIYGNADALGQALKKGEIDFADSMEANVWESLEGEPGITKVSATYSGFNQLAFNTGAALDDGTPIGDGSPLLKDVKLRQALGWAIDRQALVDRVLGGSGSTGSTIIPPIYSTLHLDPANPVTYDPEKAKQLLDAAGYTAGADGIRQDAEGNRLSFRLFARSDSDNSVKSVEFIKGYLAAVGVETEVKAVSSDALTEIIGQGNFDMFEWGWVVEPDPNYQLSTFTCANRSYKDGDSILANLSDSFYCDEAYDALFDQQGAETDAAKRADLVKQMQQKLYDDAPYIITYYYDNLEAYRSDRFTGFVPQPAGTGSLLFQYGTWSYENVKPVSDESPSGSASASTGPAPSEQLVQRAADRRWRRRAASRCRASASHSAAGRQAARPTTTRSSASWRSSRRSARLHGPDVRDRGARPTRRSATGSAARSPRSARSSSCWCSTSSCSASCRATRSRSTPAVATSIPSRSRSCVRR